MGSVSQDIYMLVWSVVCVAFVVIGALVGFIVRYIINSFTKSVDALSENMKSSVDSLSTDMRVMEKSVTKLNSTFTGLISSFESVLHRVNALEAADLRNRDNFHSMRNDVQKQLNKVMLDIVELKAENKNNID